MAAGSLLFGYGRRAYAQVIPPAPPCDNVVGTTVTCTGDVSGGVATLFSYTVLNVNTLTANITPALGVPGIEFTSNYALTINANTGAFAISVIGGGTAGIHAESLTDAVTVDSNGNVTSANDIAIYAYTQGASAVSVTSNGTLIASDNGINAQSTGGNVTVDSTGNITANSGASIIAKSTGTGIVQVTNAGNLTGTASDGGIYARSGSGSVTVDSTGDIGANGAAVEVGILANTIANSTISVTSNGNIVAENGGIVALSGGGGVTIDSTGDVTSTGGFGIYARDTTGNILVTNDGAVVAEMNAIDALATNGAVTVGSTGNIASNTGIAIVAKSQGAGDVLVTSSGNLSGTAMTSGIYARGVSGTVTVDSTGNIGTTGGIPQFGILANSGTSSNISVTSVGNVMGQNAGIAAQSSTGSATIDSTGDITSSTYGLFASSDGASAVSVTSNGAVMAASNGIFAESAGGTIEIDSTGDVTSTGGFGIYARDTTGNILVTNDGAVVAEMNAIDALATNGAVTVGSTGNIASNTGIAIVAKSQGAGDVLVTSSGNLSGTAMTSGIYARGVSGTVTVNSTGNIGTTGGIPQFGILANSGTSSNISVTSVGNIVGQNGGIAAQTDTGTATINSTGDITSGTYGLFASNGGAGAISVTSIGSVTATTNDAVHVEGGSSADVLLQGGMVHGGDDGVNFVGGAANTLTNFAALSGDNLAVRGTTGAETVNNYGIVTGNVDLGAGANAFNNRAGATFNSGTTVNLGAANTLTNAGNLSPGGIGSVQTTALTGNIVQTGSGTFTVDIAGASADRINATGTAQLAGKVVVNVAAVPTADAYIILTAAGGVTNLGLGLTSPAFLTSLLFPDPFTVVLGLTVEFSVDGLNRNERALAGYLNASLSAGIGGLNPVLTGLLNAGDLAGYKHALDQLLPEIYSDEQIASLFAHLAFAGNLLSCRVNGTDTAAIIHEGQCLWAGATAGFLDSGSTFQLLGFTETAGRFAAGAQVAIAPEWRLGFGAGYQSSTLETATNASAEGEAGQAGVSLKYNRGPFLLAGVISGGRSWYDTTRPMAFGGFAATAQGDAEIDTLNGGLRLAYVLGSPELYFKPVMDAAVTRVDLHGLTETGGGAANLNVRGETPTVYTFAPSLEMGTERWLANGTLIRPFLRAGATWFTNTYFGLNSTFVAAPAGVAPFLTITGMDDVMGTVGAGLDVINGNDAVLHFAYDGQLGQTTQIHSVGLKGSARF